MTQPVHDPGFVADLKRAASVWRGNPVVPGIYLTIASLYGIIALTAPEPAKHCLRRFAGTCPPPPGTQQNVHLLLSTLFLPVMVFQIGLAGTARVWYARRFSDDLMSAREVWNLSWRFLGRFLLLGLMFLAVALPFWILGIVLSVHLDQRQPFTVGLLAGTILGDVLFTFATTGLALFNGSAGAAFKGGVRMLRTAWPECAAYALLPPLAILVTARFATDSVGKNLSAVLAVLAPLLTLLCAGATTSFALRRYPARGRNGTLVENAPWSRQPTS